MIDLHTHTTFSDGRFSPTVLVHAAHQRGVQVLAITDHDNTRGVPLAQHVARRLGLEIIPGIEFTTRWEEAHLPTDRGEVDLLGYLVDFQDPAFHAVEQGALDDTHERVNAVCLELRRQGCPISMADVFQQNQHYAGPLPLLYTLQRIGWFATYQEAFCQVAPLWSALPGPRLSIQEAIHAVHRAGGVAVLAHPFVVKPNGERLSLRWLEELVEAGLDGLEIYHPSADEAARAYLLDLTSTLELIVTGGSDLHGWRDDFSVLGSQAVTPEMLAALKARPDRF